MSFSPYSTMITVCVCFNSGVQLTVPSFTAWLRSRHSRALFIVLGWPAREKDKGVCQGRHRVKKWEGRATFPGRAAASPLLGVLSPQAPHHHQRPSAWTPRPHRGGSSWFPKLYGSENLMSPSRNSSSATLLTRQCGQEYRLIWKMGVLKCSPCRNIAMSGIELWTHVSSSDLSSSSGQSETHPFGGRGSPIGRYVSRGSGPVSKSPQSLLPETWLSQGLLSPFQVEFCSLFPSMDTCVTLGENMTTSLYFEK